MLLNSQWQGLNLSVQRGCRLEWELQPVSRNLRFSWWTWLLPLETFSSRQQEESGAGRDRPVARLSCLPLRRACEFSNYHCVRYSLVPRHSQHFHSSSTFLFQTPTDAFEALLHVFLSRYCMCRALLHTFFQSDIFSSHFNWLIYIRFKSYIILKLLRESHFPNQML